MSTHLTWSVEKPLGKCPECGTKTVLILASNWHLDGGGWVEVPDEVSGHFCQKCNRLRSLSLNTENP